MYTRLSLLLLYFFVCGGVSAQRLHLRSAEPTDTTAEEDDDRRVIGGYETTITKHPYQVSLRYKGKHRCGGAIISDSWVITAAHCVKSLRDRYTQVKAGSSTLSGRGQIVNVERIIIHEDYSGFQSDYDIALVQLDSPLAYGRNVGPIDLAPSSESYSAGSMASVTGWGVSYESSDELSNYLREVAVPLITNNECRELYGNRLVSDRMLCAGYVGVGGKDACQGDSGGPLVQDDRLIGIVSWGQGCAEPSYPGVYTRVTVFRSWISEKTGL